MIQSVNDFKFYVQEDSKWYITDKRKKPRLFSDEVWHYLISMRKLEYYTNCNGNMIKRLFWRWRFHILGIKLGFDIPLNTCGPGLCIRHWGCIVINPLAKLGSNCIIQQGVVIGRGNHFDDVPQIGDNCYIGPGAKLYGKIVIGNNNVIGANAVVNKSYKDENVIIAGIPAKITGKKNVTLDNQLFRSSVRDYYAISVGLLPFLMVYKLPFISFGLGVLLSIVFLPYVFVKLLKGQWFHKRLILPVLFLVYYAYAVSDSFNNSLLCLIALIHIVASSSSLDYKKFAAVIKSWSLISSLILLFQWLIYHTLGVFVSFIWDEYMLDGFQGVKGIVEGGSVARISSVFAEPSHFSKYALIGLSFILFEDSLTKKQLVKSAIISLAILLSTSGIGVVGVVVLWSAYYLYNNTNNFRKRNLFINIIFLIIGGGVVLYILYNYTDVGFSINRIIGSQDGYNAIEGRTVYSEMYLTYLVDGKEIYGLGFFEFDYYVVGYVKILMYSGYLGLSLLILASLCFMSKISLMVNINIVFFIVFLFFANIAGGMNFLFYFILFNSLYVQKKRFLTNL